MQLSRRGFLKISAASYGSLALQIVLPASSAQNDTDVLKPNLFVTFKPNGSIEFRLTKHEMGQGVSQSLPAIFADELGAEWAHFNIIQASFSTEFSLTEQGNTGGSNSVRRLWIPLRQAAANTRQLFIDAACKVWDTTASQCRVKDSFVINKTNDSKLAFKDLIAVAATMPVPEDVALKSPDDFKYIGKEMSNPRVMNIVNGSIIYTSDVVVPGMVYAVIARCPYYRGNVAKVNADEVSQLVGVKGVYQQEQYWGEDDSYVASGIAVVADTTWGALQARKKLQVTWQRGPFGDESSSERAHQMQIQLHKTGEQEIAIGNKAKDETTWLKATYENPYQTHVTMETLGAVASVTSDSVEIWGAMQNPALVASEVAKVTGLPKEKIQINLLPSGGSFGRRYYSDIVLEAVMLSRQVGKPVKVMWTREDDIKNGFVHALQLDQHQAFFDDDGNLSHWQLKQVICSDGGTRAHAWNPYGIPNQHAESVFIEGRMPIGAWRSVWSHQAALGLESFVDEIAHYQQQDPYEYRKKLLNQAHPGTELDNLPWYAKQYAKDQKISRALLDLVAEKSNWYGEKAQDQGRGIAVYRFLTGGHVAHVVDLSVKDGQYHINKVTSAVYIGQVVNPDTVKAQVEGSVIWALSAVLYNKIDLVDGKVAQSNFHDYPVVRHHEAPDVDVHILESNDAPLGIGEPAVPPFAPAMLNAIFDATGQRIRKLPLLAKVNTL